jgi:hypothetical protein
MPIHNGEPNRTTNGGFAFSRDSPDEPLTAVKAVLVTLFMRRGDSKHVRQWSIFLAVTKLFDSDRSSWPSEMASQGGVRTTRPSKGRDQLPVIAFTVFAS